MKSIVTLIAGLVAVSAFATEPAKTPVAPAATAAVTATPAAPAKKDEKKVEKKAVATPVKSQAPATKDAAKTTEPAKK